MGVFHYLSFSISTTMKCNRHIWCLIGVKEISTKAPSKRILKNGNNKSIHNLIVVYEEVILKQVYSPRGYFFKRQKEQVAGLLYIGD